MNSNTLPKCFTLSMGSPCFIRQSATATGTQMAACQIICVDTISRKECNVGSRSLCMMQSQEEEKGRTETVF
jgi:hypothetical protein